MESDDDIRYTVLGQCILREAGPHFRSSQVLSTWLNKLPYALVFTAEMQAYRNVVLSHDEFRVWPDAAEAARLDEQTDWIWTSHHLNPFREWIGAQIRVDAYGYACPGHPQLAAEMAFRDARISHAKNGIYGAMLCAAMIAAAFATGDVREIIEAGLAEIPCTSRLYSELRQVIAICEKYDCDFARFESVIEEIHALLGHYNPVHTNNNAALCVAALLLGAGDFHKGITFAVMGGWDTDCNGATVGSIVGAMNGASQLPSHWTARLNDTLNSLIADYHPIAISRCAQYSLETARQTLCSG
jgi:ADP-ribosylglycohydrolase